MLNKILRFLFGKNVTKFARLQTLKVTANVHKNNIEREGLFLLINKLEPK